MKQVRRTKEKPPMTGEEITMTDCNRKQDFKIRMLESVNALRHQHSVKELALELYQMYELKTPPQSFIAHIGACFNSKKPEFFNWCDVVNLMKITGCHEPLLATCDELGLERPAELTPALRRRVKIRRIRVLQQQLEAEQRSLDELGDPGAVVGARFSR